MDAVRLSYSGPVAVITMDNGENRFNPLLVGGIHKHLDEIENNASAKAVIFTGSGKYFSNGLDLDSLVKLPPDEIKVFQASFHRMRRRLAIFPRPTVGAINGHAFAGGAMLACLMDFRYMRSDRGWFCLPEVDIQLPFWPGMIALIRGAVPDPYFRDMAYGGTRYTADELVKMEVIDGAYPNEELMDRCMESAKFLATKNTASYAEIKKRSKMEMIRVMDQEDPKYFM